jgi:hypothetical protein
LGGRSSFRWAGGRGKGEKGGFGVIVLSRDVPGSGVFLRNIISVIIPAAMKIGNPFTKKQKEYMRTKKIHAHLAGTVLKKREPEYGQCRIYFIGG